MKAPMHLFISTIALSILCAAFAAPAFAGPGGDRDGRHRGLPSAEERVAWMSEKLDLSDAQSAQLLEVMQRAEEERQALRQQFEAEMKPEICAAVERTSEEIRSILDPAQVAQFDEMLARRGEFAERRGRRGPSIMEDC